MRLKEQITSKIAELKSLHNSTPNKLFNVHLIVRLDRKAYVIFHDDLNNYITYLTIEY